MKPKPQIGEVFDRLTVTGLGAKKGKIQFMECRCSCGNLCSRSAYELMRWKNTRSAKTASCGCARSSSVSLGRQTAGLNSMGGLSTKREYDIWRGMLRRCYDEKATQFRDYGGRGISVCKRWRDDFLSFWRDMGQAPEGYSLDRIDNAKGYSPSNCRWASRVQQNSNTRRNRFFTAFGKTQHLSAWARERGLLITTLKHRIDVLGMPIEKALSAAPH